MDDPFRRPTLGSAVFYKDPFAALDWLEKAFGFERSIVITDAEGNLGHAEMKFGDGYIMVGAEWADHVASPLAVGGRNTQGIHVHLTDGIDAVAQQLPVTVRIVGAAREAASHADNRDRLETLRQPLLRIVEAASQLRREQREALGRKLCDTLEKVTHAMPCLIDPSPDRPLPDR